VDVADVDVVERGGGLRLLDEPVAGVGVGRPVGRKELERDEAPEADVLAS